MLPISVSGIAAKLCTTGTGQLVPHASLHNEPPVPVSIAYSSQWLSPPETPVLVHVAGYGMQKINAALAVALSRREKPCKETC